MGRQRTGTIEWRDGKAYLKLTVTLDNGNTARRKVLIPGATTPAEAESRKARIAAKAQGRTFASNTAPTILVRDYVEKLWVPSRLRRGLKTARKDGQRLTTHVFKLIGHLQMQDVTSDDLRDLVEALDVKIHNPEARFGWKMGRHVWMTTKKLFKDACRSKVSSLRVLVDNPAENVEGPDRGPSKAKQWLYPAEFSSLMACNDLPLRWRRIYAVTTLLFLRWGEVRAIDWRDLDLKHGTAHIHEQMDDETGELRATKAADVRDVPIEPTLLPLLRVMHRESGGEGRLFESIDKPALTLREHLLRAGVDRNALHRSTATSLAMRFHDLRATGITWMAVRGDGALRIRERAGHAEFSQTEEYIRRAELVGPNVGTAFPPLPAAVLGDESSPNIVPAALVASANLQKDEGFGVRRRGLEAPTEDASEPAGPGSERLARVRTGTERGEGTIQGTIRLPPRKVRPSVQKYVADRLKEAYPLAFGKDPKKVLAPLRRAARALVQGKAPRRVGAGR